MKARLPERQKIKGFDAQLATAQGELALALLEHKLVEMGYSPFDIVWKPHTTDSWSSDDDEVLSD